VACARALKKAGARVELLSPKPGRIQAFRHLDKGSTFTVDRPLQQAQPDRCEALLLPRGALNADALWTLPEVQTFVRHFQRAGKPVAIICHARSLLVSAHLVRDALTRYHTIQDDIRNAGRQWVDQEVVEDGNRVTSRQPKDLPAFNKAMIWLYSSMPLVAGR
jgi:protease I